MKNGYFMIIQRSENLGFIRVSHRPALQNQTFMQKIFVVYLVGPEGRYSLWIAQTRSNCHYWALSATTNSNEWHTWGEKVFYWQWEKESDFAAGQRVVTAKTTLETISDLKILSHTACSLNLALLDYHLFKSMPHHMADSHFWKYSHLLRRSKKASLSSST